MGVQTNLVRTEAQLAATLATTQRNIESFREKISELGQKKKTQLELMEQQWLVDKKAVEQHAEQDFSKRLETIPGVGPITATRVIAEVADPASDACVDAI